MITQSKSIICCLKQSFIGLYVTDTQHLFTLTSRKSRYYSFKNKIRYLTLRSYFSSLCLLKNKCSTSVNKTIDVNKDFFLFKWSVTDELLFCNSSYIWKLWWRMNEILYFFLFFSSHPHPLISHSQLIVDKNNKLKRM